MKEVIYVLGALEDQDIEALMRIGTKEQLQVSDKLLTEGNHPDAIYLVIEGELEVSVQGRDTPIRYVGKGEVVGEMSLLESDDILEAGIEIVAQPPGKRLQNILLLSGGEKAMTAIALVLAIFKYRPSPFCLLDEVDAPLDDANVGRFVNKVAEMSEKTQFIVITHNKRTMEAARALYGVTMQEPGVSKVVSVKFE